MKKQILAILAIACLTTAGCSQRRTARADEKTPASATETAAEASRQGEGVDFQDLTFEQALQKATAENRLIFMDAYASWCGPCKYMATRVFTQPEAGNYFNRNFINVKYDMEKGEGVGLARRYEVKAYPTFLILNGKGDVLGRIVGGDEVGPFIRKVEKIVAELPRQGQ